MVPTLGLALVRMKTLDVAGPGRRTKRIIGGALIIAGLAGLAAWAITSPGALAYYKTPTEAAAEGATTRTLRVGGRVGDLDRDGAVVTFKLGDGSNEVPVVYRGDVPDTLKEQTDAVAEGSLRSDGTLVATRVQAKCSSKFVTEEDAPEHLGKT